MSDEESGDIPFREAPEEAPNAEQEDEEGDDDDEDEEDEGV